MSLDTYPFLWKLPNFFAIFFRTTTTHRVNGIGKLIIDVFRVFTFVEKHQKGLYKFLKLSFKHGIEVFYFSKIAVDFGTCL